MTSHMTNHQPSPWAAEWRLRDDTIYLNHGSFGPPPEKVRRARQGWRDELDCQPMDFFCRQVEPAWHASRRALAEFVGTDPENLVFVDNATYAMNVVARSFPLRRGDEVVLTDHEYGAVERIWRRACREQGAREPVIAKLPWPVESAEQILMAIEGALTDRTRLLVVSHITSPTAVILPVRDICRMARRRGVGVCIDGPHALVQLELNIDALDCDFYTASCHKWLCAPFGSGFLYVRPEFHERIEPPVLSWGRLPPQETERWSDEFLWLGTRDVTAALAVPEAIHFFRAIGLPRVRSYCHELAQYARCRLHEEIGAVPMVPDSSSFYGFMAHVELPPGPASPLQNALWEQHGIEVPVVSWQERRALRVSCHLYNDREQIDRLVTAVAELLPQLS